MRSFLTCLAGAALFGFAVASTAEAAPARFAAVEFAIVCWLYGHASPLQKVERKTLGWVRR